MPEHWTTYNYRGLAVKDTFDCLAYLALVYVKLFRLDVVVRRLKTPYDENNQLIPNGGFREVFTPGMILDLGFGLIPVAEVAPGVFIRGDSLEDETGAGVCVGDAIASYPSPYSETYFNGIGATPIGVSAGYYDNNVLKDWTYDYMPCRIRNLSSSDYPPTFRKGYSLHYVHYASASPPANPLVWDKATETATLTVRLCPDAWRPDYNPDATIFPWHEAWTVYWRTSPELKTAQTGTLDLTSEYTYTTSIHCATPPEPVVPSGGIGTTFTYASATPSEIVGGDPITAPLYKFPYVRNTDA